MTVYNVNRGIGWASSGVEYAQAYRAGIFRKIGQDSKFIFTDMFQAENLAHFTANIGFKDNEIIWLYGFFTDVKVAATTYSLEQFEGSLTDDFQKVNQTSETVRYQHVDKELTIAVFLRKGESSYVQRVEFLSKGKLIRKDYYSYTRIFSEYYAPKDNKPHIYQRTFFNEDGSVAYEENCDGERSIFRFSNTILYSKEELIGYMFELLKLTSQDVILIDRATGVGPAILRHKGPAKAVVVVHAEHYSLGATTEHTVLWNNYYEFQFSNADKIAAFIVSTDAQKQVLEEQFATYTDMKPKVIAIPVGSLDQLYHSKDGRKPYSLLTCSRLASEKHIDWLVEAVVLAQKDIEGLTFDIYGEGGQRATLERLIQEYQAQDFIKLRGHHNLTEVYQQYEVYLTASTSEGFGLTLMEAIGSGLPIIGLDVPYGNTTFVQNRKNGYLIPRTQPDNAKQYAQSFAKALVELYQSNDLSTYHQTSYQRAEEFLTSRLEETWKAAIKEVVEYDTTV